MKFKTIVCAFLAFIFVSQVYAQKSPFKSQIDSVSYAIGVSIGENLKKEGVKGFNTKLFAQAIDDVLASDTTNKKAKNKVLLTMEQASKVLQSYFQELYKKKAEAETKKGEQFLLENKKKQGVTVTESGIQYEIITAGTGPKPNLQDTITVHYKGMLTDGSVFDSSIERGEPATFPLSNVIQGWQQAMQLMPVGSKWRIVIPSNLAYGEAGAGDKIKPNSVLVFEVELIEIKGKK